MSLFATGMSSGDVKGGMIELLMLKRAQMAQASSSDYDKVLQEQEKALNDRHLKGADGAESPINDLFAVIQVDGKTVASILNSGAVIAEEGQSDQIAALLSQEKSLNNGPALAEERAAKIAEFVGGEAEKSASALSQVDYDAARAAGHVDQEALQADPGYKELIKMKDARTRFLAGGMNQQAANTTPIEGQSVFTMSTNKGMEPIDLDSYFSVTGGGNVSLQDVSLLLPNKQNIDALKAHLGPKIQQMMREAGIPAGPDDVKFGNDGQLHLSAGYPYKDAFEQALQDNPEIERELQTLGALASHYVGMNGGGGGYSGMPLGVRVEMGPNGDLKVYVNGQATEDLRVDAAQRASDGYDKQTKEQEAEAEAQDETSNLSSAEQWFMDYQKKTPEEKLFEAILRDLGLTKEEYEALPPEQRKEIDEKIQEEMERRTKQGLNEAPEDKKSIVA